MKTASYSLIVQIKVNRSQKFRKLLSMSQGRFLNKRSLFTLWTALVVCFVLTLGSSHAQSALPQAARDALLSGQQAASAALATYDAHYLDRPLWKEAIDFGREAQRLAPERPEPYRFLGQVYTTVNWHIRAWEAWQRYEALGGTFDVQASRYASQTSRWLGNNSFKQGQYEQAITFYGFLGELEPQDTEAAERLALSYLELDQPEQARAYLQELVSAQPNNATYAELLQTTEEQVEYGVLASRAYREGLALLEAGNKADALIAFRRATEANVGFKDAFVQAGQLSAELNQPQAAAEYFRQAVALDPQDSTAQEALAFNENQARWGVQAYRNYQAGVAAHAAGRVNEAQTFFEAAVASNERYGDAWAWLGRIAFEDERLEDSVQFYDRARTYNPNDATSLERYAQVSQLLAEQQEAERLEEEAKLEEEARLEAERLEQERLAAEAAQRAEQERLAEEARIAEEQAAEEARLEQERLAEEAALEAERLAEA